jgi:hypothetical protein
MGGAALEVTSICFIWGLLQHKPVLQPLLLRELDYEDASLSGYVAVVAPGASTPFPIAQAGGVLHGKLLRDLNERDMGVLSYAQDCMGYAPEQVTVDLASGGRIAATVFMPKTICQTCDCGADPADAGAGGVEPAGSADCTLRDPPRGRGRGCLRRRAARALCAVFLGRRDRRQLSPL